MERLKSKIQSSSPRNDHINQIIQTQTAQTELIAKISRAFNKTESDKKKDDISSALVRTNKAVNKVTSLSRNLSSNLEDTRDTLLDMKDVVDKRFSDLEIKIESLKQENTKIQQEIKLYAEIFKEMVTAIQTQEAKIVSQEATIRKLVENEQNSQQNSQKISQIYRTASETSFPVARMRKGSKNKLNLDSDL